MIQYPVFKEPAAKEMEIRLRQVDKITNKSNDCSNIIWVMNIIL